jgi:hypothetical protein
LKKIDERTHAPPIVARKRIKEGEDNEYRSVAVNDEQQSRFLNNSGFDHTRYVRGGQAISAARRFLGAEWRGMARRAQPIRT